MSTSSNPSELPSRWRWLTLTLVVNLLAIGALVGLHQRRERATDAEQSARLFAAEIRQAVEDITLMRVVLADDDGTLTRKIVTATVSRAQTHLGSVSRLDPRRTRILLEEAATIERAARSSSVQVSDAILPAAADRAQAVAAEIATSQGARAKAAARQSLVGSSAVLLLTVFLIAALLQRSQRAILRATQGHAAALREMADHDQLTGLPNRRRLQADLKAATGGLSSEAAVEIAICDLNGFKAVNDRLGHEAGDRLLCDVSRRLTDAVAGRGTVYRLGGDEFCVVSRPGLRIGGLVDEALSAPRPIGDGPVGSAGVARWPCDAESASGVIRLADDRMYAAKHGARQAAASAA